MYAVPIGLPSLTKPRPTLVLIRSCHDLWLADFVAGYWMARSANQGLAMIVFNLEEAAQDFADLLKTVPDTPGVMLDRESIGATGVLASSLA